MGTSTQAGTRRAKDMADIRAARRRAAREQRQCGGQLDCNVVVTHHVSFPLGVGVCISGSAKGRDPHQAGVDKRTAQAWSETTALRGQTFPTARCRATHGRRSAKPATPA